MFKSIFILSIVTLLVVTSGIAVRPSEFLFYGNQSPTIELSGATLDSLKTFDDSEFFTSSDGLNDTRDEIPYWGSSVTWMHENVSTLVSVP